MYRAHLKGYVHLVINAVIGGFFPFLHITGTQLLYLLQKLMISSCIFSLQYKLYLHIRKRANRHICKYTHTKCDSYGFMELLLQNHLHMGIRIVKTEQRHCKKLTFPFQFLSQNKGSTACGREWNISVESRGLGF